MDYPQFLQLISSNDAIFVYFIIIGMSGHYAKKRVKAETDVTFGEWFLNFKVYSTIVTIVVALITIFGALSNNIINDTMSISTIIYTGLTTGFAIDSLTNGDS
jgi:L-asparagine transporter-like permease